MDVPRSALVPYAWRFVRRRPAWALLVAAAVAASVLAGAVAAGTARADALRLAARVDPTRLPADLAVWLPPPAGPGALSAVGQAPGVARWEEVPVAWIYGPAGAVQALGLVPGGMVAGRLRLAEGSLPSGAGALLPAHLARAAGLAPGDVLSLSVPWPDGRWRSREVPLSGLYHADFDLPGGILLPADLLDALAGPAAGRLAWVIGRPGTSPAELRQQVGYRLAGRPAAFLDAGHGRRVAADLAARLHGPAWTVTGLVWLCSGLGAMHAYRVGVLARRRDLGVLRALGLEDAGLRALLLAEAAILSAAGAGLGWAAALLAARYAAPDAMAPTPAALVLAGALAVPLALAAAWGPYRLVRRLEVQRLLRPYVFGR